MQCELTKHSSSRALSLYNPMELMVTVQPHLIQQWMLHPVGIDSFVEMNALDFQHKYWVTYNNRLLSRFRCQSTKDLRPRSRECSTIQ